MITLTQRLLASAVVSSSVEGDYFTITITKANHGISINTSAKINITGLDFYTANLANGTKAQDFYNGDKIFTATTTDNLVYKIQLRTFPAELGIISGTPVVNIVNSSWELEAGKYLFQTTSGVNVNWNGNKIKIFAEYQNGDLTNSVYYTQQNNSNNYEFSIDGRTLTFDGLIKKAIITLQTIDNLTNIPLFITKL
jgi:hypothetical protein